ncbi:uncharacterized protein LOC132294398 [Cornus florida]|uniref:uncharacterized protein LOC132294398 n=1 Tax=Cornus florida TaxID=4283 RepID=UPI0028978C27|nr:uncharacterized protein LOC132294398 [Cornus florida]
MSNEALQSLSLKVLVEKEKTLVVFAESNEDFVDVLFSFMTMPIGTIIRLGHEHSLEVDFGCLNNLYESVENLDEELLQSVKCKDLLLCPRSAAEIYCRNLKFNFVNSDTNVYYACRDGHYLGPYFNARCDCGQSICYAYKINDFERTASQKSHRIETKNSFMDPILSVDRDSGSGSLSDDGDFGFVRRTARQPHLVLPRSLVPPVSLPQGGGVFVKPTARFLITDDFHVKPMSTMTGLTLLSKLGATDRSTREERAISIGRDKVVKLLMRSLTSRAPFSETILEPDVDRRNFGSFDKRYGPRSMNQSQRAVDATKNETNITFKLIVHKSNNRALFVEAKEDFVDLIGSFLTFPLGYVFEKFSCLSLRGCLGNLYKSIQDLDCERFLKSEDMKAKLVNPKLPPGLVLDKQLIPIKEASYPSLSTAKSLLVCSSLSSHKGEKIIGKGFIRGPSNFMVTDDLTITPLSPISGISFIDRLNIPHSDIFEQEMTMGEEEALRLLEAALVSKTALTDTFILTESKLKLYGNSHMIGKETLQQCNVE